MMRKPLKGFNDFQVSEKGQATVEYILMLVFALSLVGLIASSFRSTTSQVWQFYTKQIAAACPGCPFTP